MNRIANQRFDYFKQQFICAQTPLDVECVLSRATYDRFISIEDFVILCSIAARRYRALSGEGEEVLA